MLSKVNETWTPLHGYEIGYLVSSKGRIFSLKSKKFLSQMVNKKGYLRVNVYKNSNRKSLTIHRAVATSFLGESKLAVNHIDGNKKNNNIDNLEFVSSSENNKHAYRLGLNRPALKNIYGDKHPAFKSPIKATNIKTGEVFIYRGSKELEDNGFSRSAVYNCTNGKSESHKGFSFERI